MVFRKYTGKIESLLKKRKGIALLGLIVVVAGAAAWIWSNVHTANAQSSSDIHTTMVKSGSIRVSASGAGTLTASSEIGLSFPTAGVVGELLVKVGDSVVEGQELAKLADLTGLEAEVSSAQLNLLEAQQALDDLTTNTDLTVAKAYQAWADALADFNAKTLKVEQLASAHRCSRNETTRLTANVERIESQLAQAVEGSDEYSNIKNSLATARANLEYCTTYGTTEKESAQAELTLAELTLNKALEYYQKMDAANGLDADAVSLAQNKVVESQSALELAQKNLAGATMTAPMDGVVIAISAGVGENAGQTSLITLANLVSPDVEVNLDQNNLAMLEVGNKAEIQFDALPERIFEGTLIQVDPSLSSNSQYAMVTGLIQVDSDLSVMEHPLPIGLNATVEVIASEADDVAILNQQALRSLGDGTYAVFVYENGKLRLRVVEVGLMDETYAEIRSGLQVGDVVSTGLVEIVG